ncbi:MAG: helix-turn-helix domain-containing protein [Candidatus Hodarchaeales archaeon]
MSALQSLTKDKLTTLSKEAFLNADYSLWNDDQHSQAFDFIALKRKPGRAKDPIKIVTKVVVDLDFFKKQVSLQLQLISRLISGFPLLISQKSSGKDINDLTLYRRHDVPAITIETLKKFLLEEPDLKNPKISRFAHRGGIYVNISKRRLRQRREELDLEIKVVSHKTGISRFALYRYEKGDCCPKLENFQLLTKVLGKDLDLPIDMFKTNFEYVSKQILDSFKQPKSKLQKEISIYLSEKEFNVLWFKSEPFDGLTEPTDKSYSEEVTRVPYPILAGVSTQDRTLDSDRIQSIMSLSKFLQKKAFWFTEDEIPIEKGKSQKSHFKIVNISDLESMGSNEFKKLIKDQL